MLVVAKPLTSAHTPTLDKPMNAHSILQIKAICKLFFFTTIKLRPLFLPQRMRLSQATRWIRFVASRNIAAQEATESETVAQHK